MLLMLQKTNQTTVRLVIDGLSHDFPGVLCINAFRYFGSVNFSAWLPKLCCWLPRLAGLLGAPCAVGVPKGQGCDWKEERWDQIIYNWIFQVCKISAFSPKQNSTKRIQKADALSIYIFVRSRYIVIFDSYAGRHKRLLKQRQPWTTDVSAGPLHQKKSLKDVDNMYK